MGDYKILCTYPLLGIQMTNVDMANNAGSFAWNYFEIIRNEKSRKMGNSRITYKFRK